jgi:hypothetical protein
MKHLILPVIFFLFAQNTILAQIFIGFDKTGSNGKVNDSISVLSNGPDADRSDIPFIDYKPAVIHTSPVDSVLDYAYIRRNFTDQMISVWNHPHRLYPASRVYGLDMDGKHYRSVMTSSQNFVFAEQMVKGEMSLYIYRKIPQVNGWVEFVGSDSLHSGYRNHMIVDDGNTRGKRENFGYFVTIGDDSLRLVTTNNMKLFADTYLTDTPHAKAMAMTYSVKHMTKERKIAVIGLMAVGFVGLAVTGGSAASWIFLAGFPAAAIVAFANKPYTLHWQDMAEIVNLYNKEKAVGGK